LHDADLDGADLAGATLVSAVLTGIEFGATNLTGANLTGADVYGGELYQADLTNANFTNANLTSSYLFGANMTGTRLAGAALTGAYSGGITGRPASLPASWSLTDFCLIGPGAALNGASLTSANLTGANLTGADLPGANLTGAFLASSNLTRAELQGADLTSADLTSADLSDANLARANLTGAMLASATLTGAIWSDTTCPDGSNSGQHVHGCLSARLYGFGGFTSPRRRSTVAKSAHTVVARFMLLTSAGKPITAKQAAALAAAHQVRATLRGAAIPAATATCTWDGAARSFRCSIKIPTKAKTGKAHPYSLTAAENLGTGFIKAPAAGNALNPETIFFKK